MKPRHASSTLFLECRKEQVPSFDPNAMPPLSTRPAISLSPERGGPLTSVNFSLGSFTAATAIGDARHIAPFGASPASPKPGEAGNSGSLFPGPD